MYYFSRFAVWLTKHDALTFPMFLDGFEKCIKGAHHEGILTEGVRDVSSWLEPHLTPIRGHSKPHCFLFEKTCGEVLIKYKLWSTSPVSARHKNAIILLILQFGLSFVAMLFEMCLSVINDYFHVAVYKQKSWMIYFIGMHVYSRVCRVC